MAIETTVTSKGIYFITFTCHNWLPLIDTADAYEDVYKFFEVIKKNGNDIVGYVIMPNHLHFLINYKNTYKKLIQ
jgi:REP element-mobilizing transposase RayT